MQADAHADRPLPLALDVDRAERRWAEQLPDVFGEALLEALQRGVQPPRGLGVDDRQRARELVDGLRGLRALVLERAQPLRLGRMVDRGPLVDRAERLERRLDLAPPRPRHPLTQGEGLDTRGQGGSLVQRQLECGLPPCERQPRRLQRVTGARLRLRVLPQGRLRPLLRLVGALEGLATGVEVARERRLGRLPPRLGGGLLRAPARHLFPVRRGLGPQALRALERLAMGDAGGLEGEQPLPADFGLPARLRRLGERRLRHRARLRDRRPRLELRRDPGRRVAVVLRPLRRHQLLAGGAPAGLAGVDRRKTLRLALAQGVGSAPGAVGILRPMAQVAGPCLNLADALLGCRSLRQHGRHTLLRDRGVALRALQVAAEAQDGGASGAPATGDRAARFEDVALERHEPRPVGVPTRDRGRAREVLDEPGVRQQLGDDGPELGGHVDHVGRAAQQPLDAPVTVDVGARRAQQVEG